LHSPVSRTAPHQVTLALDPVRHATTRGATLWRVDASGRKRIGALAPGTRQLTVDVGALEGVLLVIEPVAAKSPQPPR